MNEIREALYALKSILTAVSPEDTAGPTAVYVYPHDYVQPFPAERTPFITVQQIVNQPQRWGVKQAGRGIHLWEIDIRALLWQGQLMKDDQIIEAAKRQESWLKALAGTLFTNMTLNGSVDLIGGGRLANEAFGDLFEYQIGHMTRGGAATQLYWGVGLRLPVRQSFAQPLRQAA